MPTISQMALFLGCKVSQPYSDEWHISFTELGGKQVVFAYHLDDRSWYMGYTYITDFSYFSDYVSDEFVFNYFKERYDPLVESIGVDDFRPAFMDAPIKRLAQYMSGYLYQLASDKDRPALSDAISKLSRVAAYLEAISRDNFAKGL